MTAAVPDPRFRDQLADALARHFTDRDEMSGCAMRCGYDGEGRAEHLADALLPLIAAEVEARVQTAANQREAETLIRLADAWDENASRWYHEHRHTHPNGIGWVGGFEEGWGEGARLLRARAAALAQPVQTGDAER